MLSAMSSALFAGSTAQAEPVATPLEQQLEQIAQEINDSTMSPYCPGRTLGACPSPQARDLRNQVHDWLKEGQSPSQVQERLIAMFGQEVTGVPKAEGFGFMAWFGPIIFLGLFLVAILYAIKRMQKRSAIRKVPPLHADDQMKTRIENELRSRMQ